jgi:hypothetical protein
MATFTGHEGRGKGRRRDSEEEKDVQGTYVVSGTTNGPFILFQIIMHQFPSWVWGWR